MLDVVDEMYKRFRNVSTTFKPQRIGTGCIRDVEKTLAQRFNHNVRHIIGSGCIRDVKKTLAQRFNHNVPKIIRGKFYPRR